MGNQENLQVQEESPNLLQLLEEIETCLSKGRDSRTIKHKSTNNELINYQHNACVAKRPDPCTNKDGGYLQEEFGVCAQPARDEPPLLQKD